ncbi:MAG: DNA polymerase I [Alphaproteobacteria bacterium]|nr:DNA polymerase I [Alphaproteobacteria bacterium]
MSRKAADKLYLIDGSGYIFRAYHALPPLTRSDGTPTGAVAGFCNILYKLLEDTDLAGRPSHFAVIFDAARKNFRNEIYPDYKAHRPPAPEDLVPQFPLVREAVKAFNLPSIELPGFEADDVIATYARIGREAGMEVVILSSDKDLMQLVRPGVSMLDPIKQKPVGEAEVRERFGVPPDKVVDVQALAGDSSDNVPGAPGIGVKTAAELITTYGDLDNLLARAEEIKQPKRRESLINNRKLIEVSRELVRLRDDAPVPDGIEALEHKPIEPAKLLAFFKAMEFRRLAERAASRLGVPAPEAAPIHVGPVKDAPKAAKQASVADAIASYVLVQDEETLKSWIAAARRAGRVAVDTETTSLDALSARLVGVSLAVAPGRACYIPLGHGDADGLLAAERPKQIQLERAIALLKPLLEEPGVLKIGQNVKYDSHILAGHGIDMAPVDDTMLISFVLDAGLHGHGMDELALLHLEHKTIAFADVAGSGKAQVTFDQVPLDKARDYAAEDADVTLRLHERLRPLLLERGLVTVYETMERPLIPILADMERAGIKVDRVELKRLSVDFAHRLEKLEGEIHALAGGSFNVASPKQLGEILFERLNLPGGKKGKTGAYGTGAEVLEDLAPQHPLPAKVLDWRQLAKLKGTYTDALQDQINPKTGRVHTSYSMVGASTGRLASSDPNLQNIPVRTEEGRKLRRCFIADAGMKLLSADYSQIELRILAHVAGVEALKQAFRDGIDIHALTASQVFAVPVEGMDPMVRRSAKAINFGIIYGMSAFGLSRQLDIPQGEAQRYIEAYFARYPGIRDYMERTKEEAHRQGYVSTLFGRRVHLSGINDKAPARRNAWERAAINAPIQGAAADVIKRAMIRLPSALAHAGLSARMLLQVHDELVFEVPDKEIDKTRKTVAKVMEGAARLSVPLTVETGVGDTWGEAH